MTGLTNLQAGIRRQTTRAVAAIVLLTIVATADFAGVASGIFQAIILHRIAGGAHVSEATIVLNDLVYAGIGIVQSLAILMTAIVFLMWLHRAYANLGEVGTRVTRFTPGWAVGFWFIPILNVFRPYQVVSETWRRSEWLNAPGISTEKSPAVVGWWWLSFLVSGTLGRIFARRIGAAEFIDEVIGATWLGVLADTASCIAALLAIAVVSGIDRHQQRMGRLADRVPSTESDDFPAELPDAPVESVPELT